MEKKIKKEKVYILSICIVVGLLTSFLLFAAGSIPHSQAHEISWSSEEVTENNTQHTYAESNQYINMSQYLQMKHMSLDGFIDEDQDGIDDRLEDILLNTYAPVVILNSQEDCWPCNVDWFLSRSHMRFHHSQCTDCPIIDHGLPNQINIIQQEHRKKHSPLNWPPCAHRPSWQRSWADFDNNHCFFLQVYTSTHAGIRPWDFDGQGSKQWIVYGHAYPNNFNGINLQYWFFFAYNDGYLIANHQGDWEHICVELYSDFSVRSVVFYQHGEPQTIHNLNNMNWYEGSHPIVLCALGSHASYPTEEDCHNPPNSPFPERDCTWCYSPVDYCPDAWYTWEGGKPEHALGYQGGGIVNVGQKLPDRQGHLNDQSFIHFSGRWGEIGYFDWTSGPRGPAYQSSWYRNAGPMPTSPYYFLALEKFPFYKAESIPNYGINQMTGAATAQMILSYLFWNSDTNPEGPVPYSDQPTLFHEFHAYETGFITVDEMAAGLNRQIDDRNQTPPFSYGYFFNAFRDPDPDKVLQQICTWLYYPIDFFNDLREVDVPKPGHPNHAPAAAPILGTEAWWVAIRGVYSDCNPWEYYPDFPESLTVYGLWVYDPFPFDFVVPSYISALEWKATWFSPIQGQYHAVIDPPSGIDACALQDYDKMKLVYPTSTPRFSAQQNKIRAIPQVLGDNIPTALKTLNKHIIIQAAQEEVHKVLQHTEHNFTEVFSSCQTEIVLSVTNEKNGQHYYIVVFCGKETGFVVRICALTGELRDFSITSEQSIQQYLETYEQTQHLVYTEGSPYYPKKQQ